jgi:hypothetical protein
MPYPLSPAELMGILRVSVQVIKVVSAPMTDQQFLTVSTAVCEQTATFLLSSAKRTPFPGEPQRCVSPLCLIIQGITQTPPPLPTNRSDRLQVL